LRLIEGSGSRRRDYLDNPLTLISPVYRQARKNYGQALIRRNKTLQAIREGELEVDGLNYWDQLLLEYAEVIHQARAKYLKFVDEQTTSLANFGISYQHSLVTKERLIQYRSAEIASGHTLIGPHKDDFVISFNFEGRRESLMTYGSRGQHRLAVLWLKLSELNYLQSQTGELPILLLDDICSELDDEAKKLVVALAKRQQTIITTTEKSVVELWLEKKVIEL
jgi:DNA replication and repair protein RecF